jgi:hypothetical protein
MAETKKDRTGDASKATGRAAGAGARVRFDTSNLKSSYANVCTMNSTREEVVINFGLNQSWERTANEVQIELSNRIILSPFAANRMLEMLQKLMDEYEKRYGAVPQADNKPN